MDSKAATIPLGFTDESVPVGSHIVYIFNEDWERRQVVARYLESGILDGEKVLCLVDRVTPEEMRKELEELGVACTEPEESMDIRQAAQAYTPKGYFSSQEMFEVVRQFCHNAQREGYERARGTGEMTWALDGCADLRELIEYEAELNDVLVSLPYTAMCQYDARKFSGSLIMDMITVHPFALIRGQIVKNPFYLNPESFLERLRQRH